MMTNETLNIEWIKQIAANQRYRSTWEANVDGKKSIIKKISAEGKKLEALVKTLRKQVTFSEILNEEEQKGICLFDTMSEIDGNIVFVRKWCEGQSLDELLTQKKRFSMSDAVKMMLKIARIVAVAHSHNVTHGDLKPANIIVSESDEVMIIDWDTMTIDNSVEEFHDSNRTVSLDQVVGTPQYMPIEQFQGDLDPQCDIYALGVILYQLLAGETPFDEAGAMTATQMAIYKQNHENASILVKHPELGINEDLAKVIELSLKNDRNHRLQTVDSLLQKLENIGKITSSAPISKPVDSNPMPVEDTGELPEGKEHKLVLIGHTGAGKTVLVAGLYASQDKDFSVDDPGSKTETGIHAINVRSIMEDGHWPAATSIGDITDLKFKINYKGRRESIAFPEYAGERLNMEGFDKLILGKPDGAFILLNPGSELLQKTHDRIELLSKIKEYIQKLGTMEKKPPVALVITASDRLENDLKDFAPKFEKYVEELILSLDTHIGSNNYKRFNVSVSGRLEDQNKPKLEPKGIKDPFIWLIEQLDHKMNLLRMRKILKYAACLIALIILAALCNWGRETYRLRDFRSGFEACQKKYNQNENKGEDALIEYRSSLVDLRKKYCSQKHVDLTQRHGICTSSCSPHFFYPLYRKGFEETIKQLEEAIDQANYQYFNKKLMDALADATPENRKVGDWLESWQPLQRKIIEGRDSLLKKYHEELPLAVTRFDAKELEKRFTQLINTPKSTFPSDLTSASWDGTALSESERKEIRKKLERLEHDAQIAVENKHFDELLATLNGISNVLPNDLKAQIESWNNHTSVIQDRQDKDRQIYDAYVSAVKRVLSGFSGQTEQLSQLVSQYKNVRDISVRSSDNWRLETARNEMDSQMVSIITQHIEKLHEKYRSTQMESSEFANPEYVSSLKTSLFVHLSDDEQSQVRQKISNLTNQTENAWKKKQEEIIDNFISSIKYSDAKAVLDEFGEKQIEGWSKNPYWNKAEEYALQRIEDEMNRLWKKFDFTESAYRHMKEFCAKVRAKTSKSELIQKSGYYTFSESYYEWLDSNPSHSISISKIETYTSYEEGAYIKRSEYAIVNHGSNAEPTWQTVINNCEETFRSSSYKDLPQFYPISVECKPWQNFILDFNPWENRDGLGKTFWGVDQELSYRKIEIAPGIRRDALFFNKEWHSKSYSQYVDISFDKIYLRIYFSVTGKTIHEILKESGLLK